MGPQRYEAAGRVIVCSHCGSDRFNAGYPSLIGGYIYDCSICTARMLFGKKPKLLDDTAA